MKSKYLVLISITFILIASMNIVSSEVSYCCEKTNEGAWCQNAPQEDCDPGFRQAPTSCESTSYCRNACCYDSVEGTCLSNTPQKVCEENDGISDPDPQCDIPQCELGCCLMGDQAQFITHTRCKRLSSLYGLPVDFKTNIANEFECISSVTSQVKGACVYEREFVRTCSFITQEECVSMASSGTETEFYPDRLCSDPELNTVCAPQEKTTCVEGKDQIYFVDSCGNLANVYDSSKINDQEYWSIVKTPSESCGAGQNNADSASCGNCDYYYGSTCKAYDRARDPVEPNFGDNICRNLACYYEGEVYAHGETWCNNGDIIANHFSDSLDIDPASDIPGSRHFRMLCYNGEVLVEPCAEYRQEVCIENDVNGFSYAGCVVNRWEDCIVQTEQKDCENTAVRDCEWLTGKNLNYISEADDAICIPLYSPGFNFWESEQDAEDMCNMVSYTCVVEYEKNLLEQDWGDPVDNEECLEDDWLEKMNGLCQRMGDCGSGVNYLGFDGYYSLEELRDISGRKYNEEDLEEELAE